MRALRPGVSGAPDVDAFDHRADRFIDPIAEQLGDQLGDRPATWSAEQIIEQLVARALAEELPRDALPRDATPVCCVESQRWPRVPPIHRACLRPRRRRNLRALIAAGVLTLSFALVVAAGLASAYQRAGAFTVWGVATGYRNTGQRLLAAGQPELALPFLLAARDHGDESAQLKQLFAEALHARLAARLIQAGSSPAEVGTWDGSADLRTRDQWRIVVAQSQYPTVAAAIEAVHRAAAVSAR